jgi:hypothetical protein
MTNALFLNWITWILIIIIIGALALKIHNRFRPKPKIQRGVEAFFNAEPIERLVGAFRKFLVYCFYLVLIAACLYGWVYESGWYPRTREVGVFFVPSKWVVGELKTCYSHPSEQRAELTALFCENYTTSPDEYHLLNVTFWGTITTERDKIWKCERGQSSLTCKLQ